MKRALGFASLILVAALVVGCNPTPPPAPTATPYPTYTPYPTPTPMPPTPTPAPTDTLAPTDTPVSTATPTPTPIPPTLSPPPPAPTKAPPPPEAPTPSAPPGSPYADRVVNYVPGPGAWSWGQDPSAALGAPDGNLNAQPAPTGFVCLGAGGLVTLEFVDNTIVDQPGPDFFIVGDPTQDDQILVEVSGDGNTWHAFPVSGENPSPLDLATVGLPFARFVRIVDVQPGTESGAEIDAVEALHSGPPQ